MPMTKESMWTAIKGHMAAIAASQGTDKNAANAYRDLVGQAMCQGIIDEIKANAVVTVTSVSGVQPGGGASGPGTGTISA